MYEVPYAAPIALMNGVADISIVKSPARALPMIPERKLPLLYLQGPVQGVLLKSSNKRDCRNKKGCTGIKKSVVVTTLHGSTREAP